MLLRVEKKSDKKKVEYDLYNEDEYLCTVSEEDYIRFELYEKNTITFEELEEIKKRISYEDALRAAIKYASTRRRTQKQVREWVFKKGYDADAADAVLDRLIQDRYLDDAAYARDYVNTRIKTSDKSINMISVELSDKGVDECITESILQPFSTQEFDRALASATKRFGENAYDEPDETRKTLKKMYRYLAYRGYGQDIIYAVMDRLGYRQSLA